MATVATIISDARALVSDGYADHLVREPIQALVDGTRLRFALTGRNILITTDGAPANPAIYRNGVAQTGLTWDYTGGSVTFAVAPSIATNGGAVEFIAEYYCVYQPDSVYLGFVNDAELFIGNDTTYTAKTDTLTSSGLMRDAMGHYVAHHVARGLSSKTAWWYNLTAGDKSIDKDSISKKFSDMSNDLSKDAERLRDDVYKQYGKRNTPHRATGAYSDIVNATPRR